MNKKECVTRLKKRNTYEISEKDEKEWYSGLIAIALVWFAFINCKPWPLLYKLLKFWLVSFSPLFYLPFVLFFLFAHSLPTSPVVNVSIKKIILT